MKFSPSCFQSQMLLEFIIMQTPLYDHVFLVLHHAPVSLPSTNSHGPSRSQIMSLPFDMASSLPLVVAFVLSVFRVSGIFELMWECCLVVFMGGSKPRDPLSTIFPVCLSLVFSWGFLCRTINQYFIPLYFQIIFQFVDVLHIFTHSSVDGHMSCCHFWLLWIILLWIFMHNFWHGRIFSILPCYTKGWNCWVVW